MTQSHSFFASRERIPWIVGITRNGHRLDKQVSAVEQLRPLERRAMRIPSAARATEV